MGDLWVRYSLHALLNKFIWRRLKSMINMYKKSDSSDNWVLWGGAGKVCRTLFQVVWNKSFFAQFLIQRRIIFLKEHKVDATICSQEVRFTFGKTQDQQFLLTWRRNSPTMRGLFWRHGVIIINIERVSYLVDTVRQSANVFPQALKSYFKDPSQDRTRFTYWAARY